MTCPICAKDSDPKYRPFCSKRCADIDLGRWMSGRYAIPTNEAPPDTGPGDGGADHPDQPPRRPN